MTMTVVPFEFQGTQVRVVTDEHGQPWVMAGDACAVLDLPNVSQAVSRLADDERSTITTSEGGPARLIISEAGLYRLIFTSRRPEAESFRRWVTHDVLPSIRRTGTYSSAPATDVAALDRRALALMVIEAEDRADALQAEVNELAPRAEGYDALIDSRGMLLIRQAAKALGWQERALRTFLVEQRLLFTRQAVCGALQWDFYAAHSAHFIARETVVKHSYGDCAHYTLHVTPRGLDLIRKRIVERKAELVAAVTS